MTEITKENFLKLLDLFSELHKIMLSDSTWEEKHKEIFSQPLAKQICEVGLMCVPDVQSTDKVEVETFYTAVYHKVKYLELYF